MPWGRNKYGAKRSRGLSGRLYDSGLERDRADELRLLEQAGEISDLVEQPRLQDLYAGIGYRPDFRYVEAGRLIYEDAKGVETERFRIVCKLWKLHGPAPLRITKRAGRHRRIQCVKTIVPLGVEHGRADR